MDKLISAQAAIDAVQSIGRLATLPDNDAVIRMSAVEYVLFNMPSAQPDLDSAYTEGYTAAESKYRKMWDEMPKIIRCRDCKKREYCRTTNTWAVAPDDDWFCADAERRTE